jgi:hypothetical protein
MGGGLRPNRVQKAVCREVLAAALDPGTAEAVLDETGISGLPDLLPEGPRDLAALSRELQPFVHLYRAVLARAGQAAALSATRQAIIRSAAVGFSRAAEVQLAEVQGVEVRQDAPARAAASHEPARSDSADGAASFTGQPVAVRGLNLTSPPPPGFRAPAEELRRRFDVSMEFFSCEGRLLEYTPDRVRFHVTACNWVRAMQNAGAPELISFFCESDERFMDGHPTHRLDRPTAIGLGHTHCDFQFVPRDGTEDPVSGGTDRP